ncbi:MAG: hypothetical protein HOP13_05490 [Alphaproteobacteria bacterium]|nr:hypothetical protein [Alphaproteobacteria bacterium]
MRQVFITLTAVLALAACGPSQTDGWTQTNTAAEITLAKQEAADMQPFRLVCAKAGPALTLTAGVTQVGMSNMAPPFALVLSGATFPATLVPGSDRAETFSATAPLSGDMLAAVRDATTVRISVNDGYAFAESAIDQGQVFEKFATDCATLTGVAAKP